MKKILLVDDEKGVVAMMKSYFEMSGYIAICLEMTAIRKYTQHSKRMQMQMPLKVGWTTGVANSRERTGSLTVKAATKWRRALHKSRCCAGY